MLATGIESYRDNISIYNDVDDDILSRYWHFIIELFAVYSQLLSGLTCNACW